MYSYLFVLTTYYIILLFVMFYCFSDLFHISVLLKRGIKQKEMLEGCCKWQKHSLFYCKPQLEII